MSEFLTRAVAWRRTEVRVFIYAACVDGAWWVLRLNGFPDHALFTLFVGGRVIGDVEDVKRWAPAWDLNAEGRPALTDHERYEVLMVMRGLGPYGAEVGQPCDGDWCGCPALTDEYIRDGTTGA